jgi:hypothetical protein
VRAQRTAKPTTVAQTRSLLSPSFQVSFLDRLFVKFEHVEVRDIFHVRIQVNDRHRLDGGSQGRTNPDERLATLTSSMLVSFAFGLKAAKKQNPAFPLRLPDIPTKRTTE